MPWPSTVGLKLKFQPSNRFMMENSVAKISQKGHFLFHVRLYNKTFAVNLIKTYKNGFTAGDNFFIKKVFKFFRNKPHFVFS